MTIALIIIGAFVALIVILNLIPKEFHTEKKITINKAQTDALNYITDFSKYQSWNPWFKLDPNGSYKTEGENGQVGSTYIWDSPNKNVGTGTQKITEITATEVKYDLAFTKPMKNQAKVYIKVEGDENQSTVKWGFNSKGSAFVGLFFNPDKMVGTKYVEGLATLKEVLEK